MPKYRAFIYDTMKYRVEVEADNEYEAYSKIETIDFEDLVFDEDFFIHEVRNVEEIEEDEQTEILSSERQVN